MIEQNFYHCVVCDKYALPSERVKSMDEKIRHKDCFYSMPPITSWPKWVAARVLVRMK